MNRTSPDVERRVLELYNEGHSQDEIFRLLNLSGQGLVAAILKRTPGYKPRETLRTFKPGPGRITAKAAAEKHRLNPPTLCKAIEQGKFPSGMTHPLAGGRRGHSVHEATFADELAQLPRCGHVGCDKPALSESACSGPHARAVETRGTKLSAETRAKMSAGKQFTPRPDVSERYKREWQEGGPLVASLLDPRKRYFKGQTRQRWHGRWNGKKGAVYGFEKGGRPPVATPEQQQEMYRLAQAGKSSRAIAQIVFGDARFHMRVVRFLSR